MPTEHNKALIRRFYEEVWGRGNLEAADDIFAADYVRHDLRPGNPLPGPAGQKQIAADFRAAFPDLQMTIDLMVAEGIWSWRAGRRKARTPVPGATFRRLANAPGSPG